MTQADRALAPTKSAIDALVDMVDGSGLAWMVSVQGQSIHECEDLARYALENRGHIRTGNEDAAGSTDFTNAERTKTIVDLTQSVGRPVAYGNDAMSAALTTSTA